MGLKLGALGLPSAVIQSPMAACTDLPFRLIAREKGLSFCFSEMVSARSLVRENEKTLRMLATGPEDRPLGAQLLGCEASIMGEAAQILESLGFDLLDLNFGCPVKKVVDNGEGAALLKEPEKAEKIFKAVRRAVKRIPVTVKLRKGFEDASGAEALRLARLAEDCGLSAVTVHGRTRRQGYRGRADYEAIGLVKSSLRIPVIGNGDVASAADALRLKQVSSCDGIMIGRAGLGNPWLYRSVDAALEGSKQPPRPPGVAERRDTLLRHLELEILHLGERQAALNARRIVLWYTGGLPNCKALRVAVYGTMDFSEIRARIGAFFDSLPSDVPPPRAPLLLSQ